MFIKDTIDRSNSKFIGESMQQRKQIIKQQDEDLEMLGNSVDSLGEEVRRST